MSVMFAAKATTVAALGTVTSVASAASAAASSVEQLALVGHDLATDYRTTVAHDLAQSRYDRTERRMHERAMDNADFYVTLGDRLSKNPKLQEYYEQSLKDMKQAHAKTAAKLTPIAAE